MSETTEAPQIDGLLKERISIPQAEAHTKTSWSNSLALKA